MAKFTLNLSGPSLSIPRSIAELSFDYVSRYQLIAEIITEYTQKTGRKPRHILDVGGLGSPLAKIVDVPVTILDNEVKGANSNERLGDGTNMADIQGGAYDVVVTSDTLEHIPGPERERFVHELVRVSNDLVILCAPFGDHGASKEEQKLQSFYEATTGVSHRWLKEHADYVLPKESAIQKYFDDTGVSSVRLNHSSLDYWQTLLSINLLANDSGNKTVLKSAAAVNKYYNEHLLFNDFARRSYRTFFVASKQHDMSYQQTHGNISQEQRAELYKLIAQFYEKVTMAAESIPRVRKMSDQNLLMRHDLDLLRAEHEHVIHSKTWRYTEPARRAVRSVRRRAR